MSAPHAHDPSHCPSQECDQPTCINYELARTLPNNFKLARGAHEEPHDGMCLLEAAAYIAGEPHSDHPECVCLVLGAAGRPLNDLLTHSERQLLVPLIPKLPGTHSSNRQITIQRLLILVDSTVREAMPLGLEAVRWLDFAAQLRALTPIADETSARSALATLGKICIESSHRRKTTVSTSYVNVDCVIESAHHARKAVATAIVAATDFAAHHRTRTEARAAARFAISANASAACAVDCATRQSIVKISIQAFERALSTNGLVSVPAKTGEVCAPSRQV